MSSNHAVGLIRTSTHDQALGLEAQRASIHDLCQRKGLELVDVVVADGISGMSKLEMRPDLQMVFASVQKHSAVALVVAEGSRVARNPLTALRAEERLLELGASILSAKGEGYGSTSAVDIFSSRVLMAQRELEANLTRERTVAALKALKAKKNGRYANGRPRFGFQVIGGELLPKLEEWHELASWFRQSKAGVAQGRIAEKSGTTRQFVNRTLKRYDSLEGLLAFTQREARSCFNPLETSELHV